MYMLIYDVFEKIARYLTVDQIIRVTRLNRSYYGMYITNKNDFHRLILRKICELLDISYTPFFQSTCTLFKMYGYFRNHWKSSKVDYLVYMVDNFVDDDHLFQTLLDGCEFQSTVEHNVRIPYPHDDTPEIISRSGRPVVLDQRNIASFNDIKYILVYSDVTKLNMVLHRFVISIKLLSSVINEILISDFVLYKRRASFGKLKSIIKYIFMKHGFGSFTMLDVTYIHSIIVMLIKYNQTNVLGYFFRKRQAYRFIGRLDYQYLVNQCIEYRDTRHLDIMLSESRIERDHTGNTIYVFTDARQISEICRSGDFKYLHFVIETLLGETVNMKLYIDNICGGIQYLIYCNRSSELLGLRMSNNYISKDSYAKIDEYIEKIYDNHNTPVQDRVYPNSFI